MIYMVFRRLAKIGEIIQAKMKGNERRKEEEATVFAILDEIGAYKNVKIKRFKSNPNKLDANNKEKNIKTTFRYGIRNDRVVKVYLNGN